MCEYKREKAMNGSIDEKKDIDQASKNSRERRGLFQVLLQDQRSVSKKGKQQNTDKKTQREKIIITAVAMYHVNF